MLNREAANYALQKVSGTLEDIGIGYYIDSGTLLSAYRNSDINLYDHDIDIRILPKQVPKGATSWLVSRLWDAGCFYVAQNFGERAELICLLKYGNEAVMVDLKFAFRKNGYVWVHLWENNSAIPGEEPRIHCYPERFFGKLETIELLGRKYPCPSPVEEYIVCHYGKDWRKFKVRESEAQMTDLKWSHMYSPPCAMSVDELRGLLGKSGEEDNGRTRGSNWKEGDR